jgi:hypothetical protein
MADNEADQDGRHDQPINIDLERERRQLRIMKIVFAVFSLVLLLALLLTWVVSH